MDWRNYFSTFSTICCFKRVKRKRLLINYFTPNGLYLTELCKNILTGCFFQICESYVRFFIAFLSQYIREAYEHKETKGHPQIA